MWAALCLLLLCICRKIFLNALFLFYMVSVVEIVWRLSVVIRFVVSPSLYPASFHPGEVIPLISHNAFEHASENLLEKSPFKLVSCMLLSDKYGCSNAKKVGFSTRGRKEKVGFFPQKPQHVLETYYILFYEATQSGWRKYWMIYIM